MNHCSREKFNKSEAGMGMVKRYRQRTVGMSGLVWKKYVCCSTQRLKNGKAPGVCGITGEVLKAGG